MEQMTKSEYDQCEAILLTKYGSVEKAIDIWLEADENTEAFDMMQFFFSQPAQHRNKTIKKLKEQQ